MVISISAVSHPSCPEPCEVKNRRWPSKPQKVDEQQPVS